MAKIVNIKTEEINRRAGFTLIEVIIAMGIFMMITVFAINLLGMTARVSSKLTIDTELLENARIAMDVITAHIRAADSIDLKNEPGSDTLAELITVVNGHEYRFTYNSSLIYGVNAKFHRIDFGGNELASHIADVRMNIENEILRIVIETDGNIGSGVPAVTEPVVLRASIDLRYLQ